MHKHLSCLSVLALSVAQADEIDAVRGAIQEWATAEKAISQETTRWQSEKALIQDMIQVAQLRVDKLNATIKEGEQLTSAADEERKALLEQSETIAAKADRIIASMQTLETTLIDLKPQLPEVLQRDLDALYQRIPESAASSKIGLGERMQTLTNLIGKIREFDQTITVEESIRSLPGEDREVVFRTLWLGLAQAYYLAPDDAGYGIPGPDGWTWHSQAELASEIRLSIELAEGTQSTPQLVQLPVQLKEGGAQ